jgi:5-methylcytosine-specific restriction protein B
MSVELVAEVVQSPDLKDWKEQNTQAFNSLFGSHAGRYPKDAEKRVTLRAPGMSLETGVPFAAYIDPSNASSGAYSGLSFALFPVQNGPCLISLVVGTRGLAPDEAILGRPGHARKANAICAWLNKRHGHQALVAWAKQDPTRTDIPVPDSVVKSWPEYKGVFDRYGKEIYALFRPTGVPEATRDALVAFLDLFFEERGYQPIKAFEESAKKIRDTWFEHLMPSTSADVVADLLRQRRYVIVQGPPGTGKTRMATSLLEGQYQGHGQTIQFHPNTTYENFIGGLAPSSSTSDLGFRFVPLPGALMKAAALALQNPSENYLLHIDEINRADLGKVLGEAIFLLESNTPVQRHVTLPYDFGEPFRSDFFLPRNLHLLGTMNSSDRSIAILDVAVRRRFAFVTLWPRMSVVEEYGCETMRTAFQHLLSIFIEHASGDAFSLVPGHSYFLEKDESQARMSLKTNLAPLLEEYLSQGYVGGFAEPVRGYLQWLQSL